MIYLVGIGPGDPELLSIKAARLLREADAVYVPQSRDEGSSVAEIIIAPHTERDKLRFVQVPMRQDRTEVLANYRRLAGELAQGSAEGLTLVFVTLGDATCYSTAQHLADELAALNEPYEYVPGISAFSAAASRTRVPLAAGRESMTVTVMPGSLEELEELAARHSSLVLMKINKRMPQLLEYVKKHAPERAVLVYRLGLPGEAVFDLAGPGEMPEGVGYLSTAILKRGGNA